MNQIERLLHIMRRLRDPSTGCDWDRAQTFATIAPYTIEEAYEVADAIDRNDVAALREELGDLLLQVVFQSQIAQDAGLFDFDDVAQAISDKMEARHPHIFGCADGSMSGERWEAIKAEERRGNGQTSAMDGVAQALPALMRAQKLQSRAARDGFDWPDPTGPLEKLQEEIAEFHEAASDADMLEEAGDLLFAAVNVVRVRGIDAEMALKQANAKFEKRYRMMEDLARPGFAALSLDEQEALWTQVKQQERQDAKN